MSTILISNSTYLSSQSPIADNLIHYRNIFSTPENFIIRRVDYSKMKVFDEKYRKESERYNSLKKIKNANSELIRNMAKTGLYLKDNATELDEACCIYCQGILSKWKKNDIPLKRHKFYYPTCPYIINLNVGNQPMPYDLTKTPNEDLDVKPKMTIILEINWPNVDFGDTFINQMDQMDIDWREDTFKYHPTLLNLAIQGCFVVNKDDMDLLKCCSCHKEIEILDGIENIETELFHETHCEYRNIEKSIEKEVIDNSETSKDFCIVEYALVNEEINARMDMMSSFQFMRNDSDREIFRSVIEHRLKSKGKDFDSQFELMHEFKKGLKYMNEDSSSDDQSMAYNQILDFILSDYPCVICLDKNVEVIFLPCGHLKACGSCSDQLSTCPVCRVLIVRRVKRFRFNT